MKEILREKIIDRFEHPVNNPRDCDQLSGVILERTGRSISSTTLRRFFGLLNSESSLSGFNLDTLAIFCGSSDYKNFIKEFGIVKSVYSPEMVLVLNEMDQLTRYTLNSISRKSLTRFSSTIPRKEINYNLDKFLKSEFTMIPLIAPGGYGKSIGLAHWIKQKTRSKSNKDVFLFCPAMVFHQLLTRGVQSSEILNLNLSDEANILKRFSAGESGSDQRLVFVIDGIDEISPSPGKIKQLIDFVTEASNLFHADGFLKIILSVREVSWQRYILPGFVKSDPDWLQYSKTENFEVGYSNIPNLSGSEVKKIIELFNRANNSNIIYECIDWEMRELLRTPLNLYFFNLLFSSEQDAKITSDELIREFANMQIFKTSLAEEKSDIIWKIIELSLKKGNDFSVKKNDIKEAYPVHLKKESNYFDAYQELLSMGILMEEKIENKYGLPITKIRFGHINFYYFLTALYLINGYEVINNELLSFVASAKKSLEWSSSVLSYIYQIAYKSEDYEAIKDFCDLPDELISTLSVKLAVGSSFRKPNGIRNRIIRKYAAHPSGQEYYFENFVDTNYLFNNFELRIGEYLKYKKNPEAILFGHSILFLGRFLSLDQSGCKKELDIISSIKPDSNIYPWPIGRLVSAKILYSYFVEGVPKVDIDGFIREYRDIAYSYESYLENGVIEFEMYIMIALMLTGEYSSLITLIENAFECYQVDDPKHSGFSYMHQHQNQIPKLFLEFAQFKTGLILKNGFHLRWEKALDNYASTFDDFQYLILLNYFLFDYYSSTGMQSKAVTYFQAATDLASHAEYRFYNVYLHMKCPDCSFQKTQEAQELLKLSGFSPVFFEKSS